MRIGLIHFNHTSRDNLVVWPDMKTAKWKPNYGDFLVSSSIVKQISSDYEHEMISFGGTPRRECDVALIRGSTYLFPSFDYASANKTIDSLDCPVAILGLGAQHHEKDVKFLDNSTEARDFIARLNEKSESISVRGQFTADIVERLGGKNIQITGCPSVFYSLSAPRVTVPNLLSTPHRSVGVSIHAGLQKSLFCRAPDRTRELHGEVISWALENAVNTAIFEQGVPLEYDVCDVELSFEERMASASKIIDNIKGKMLPEQVIAHMVSVKSIEEWVSKARDLDAIVGFRFHGNMVALLQGKPCFYFAYDSRLQEFCELYNLPHQLVEDDWSGDAMLKAMTEHNWDSVNSGFEKLFVELRSFYKRNGIQTALSVPKA